MSAPYQGLGPTLAECLTAEKIALTAELAQVKAEVEYWIDAMNALGHRKDVELAQVKAGWAEDDARLQRAEEGWAEAAAKLAQVKAERDDAVAKLVNERELQDLAESQAEAERDTALRHLEAVLEWSNTERFAGRTRHEDDAPSLARAFLLSMQDGSNP